MTTVPSCAPECKRAPVQIDDVGHDGRFEGYASVFGEADLCGDIVMAGAFARSLRQRGTRGVRMLWQHDPAQPIGCWETIAEDARGLFVRGRLSLATARGRDVHALMADGALDGLSIGFRTVRARAERAAGLRRILEADLWEISVVTFPMLPTARIATKRLAPPIESRPERLRAGAEERPRDAQTRLAATIRRATRTIQSKE